MRPVVKTFRYAGATRSTSEVDLSYHETTTTVRASGAGLELSRRTVAPSVETSRVIDSRDAAGRTIAWTWHTGAGSHTAGASFDGAGRLTGQSGLGFGPSGVTYTYSEATGRKSAESYDLAFEGADTSASYAYTDAGRLATATIGATITAYAYDLAGNLTTAGAVTLHYGEGNRLTRTEVSGATETTYTFDGRGRRVSEGPPEAPSRITYAWDAADRLTSYADTSAGTTAAGLGRPPFLLTPAGWVTDGACRPCLTLLGLSHLVGVLPIPSAMPSGGQRLNVWILCSRPAGASGGRRSCGMAERSGADRLPPGQHLVDGFPVLHYGEVPRIDRDAWRFRVFGEVDEEHSLDLAEFTALPAVDLVADIHCVTTWSKFDTRWRGVPFREVHERSGARPEATYVLVHAAPDYTTGLPLEALLDDDVLFALEYEGEPLSVEHGGPVRLVVPKRYFYKSAKWVTGIEYLTEPRLGFWERSGYSESADPWREERYA